MLCSVCIATYKRSELLEKLLDSLYNQEITDNITFEVIVVDNDSLETAKETVLRFQKSDKLDIKYFIQPVKNISLTRNKCVENSGGEYILFIDDDEIASPVWIQTMIRTVLKYNADAVFGQVKSHFDAGIPEWVKKNHIYNRPAPPTGTEATLTRSGNCIVKASLLKSIPGPFDPAYGLTGGEDTHLFGRLKRQGARYVNCKEAWISEYVPPERTTVKYLLKRSYLTGNNFTRRYLELSSGDPIKKYKAIIKAIVFGTVSIFLTLFTFPNKYWGLHWATKIASNWGHLKAAFGHYVEGYN